MKAIGVLAAVLLPAAAVAQAGSYKLVLTWSQGGITVVDYTSQERCERALRAVEAARLARIAEAERRAAAQGAKLVGAPWTVQGFCIPG